MCILSSSLCLSKAVFASSPTLLTVESIKYVNKHSHAVHTHAQTDSICWVNHPVGVLKHNYYYNANTYKDTEHPKLLQSTSSTQTLTHRFDIHPSVTPTHTPPICYKHTLYCVQSCSNQGRGRRWAEKGEFGVRSQ